MVLATFTFWRKQPEPVVLAEVFGVVAWIDQAGHSHNDVKPGDELLGGIVQVQGTTSFAKLLFRDGSTITLGGESEATIAAGAKAAYIIKEPVAAAIGADIPISSGSCDSCASRCICSIRSRP